MLAPTPETVEDVAFRAHRIADFRYESRLVRSGSPRLQTVLLVGGAFQRKEDWGRFERGWLAHADVLTVDLPGWGTADLLPEHYGIDFLSEALGQVLDDLKLSTVNIVAGSYGTGIAYRLAQLREDTVRRMALIGTMTEIPAHCTEAFQHTLDLLSAGRFEEFITTTVDLALSSDPAADVVRQAAIRRMLLHRVRTASPREIEMYVANTRRLMNHAFGDFSSPPTQPILVATGEYDTFTTPRMCRELADTCADSQLAIVKRADHLVHMERAAELVDLLARFLAGESIADLPYCRLVERVRPRVG